MRIAIPRVWIALAALAVLLPSAARAGDIYKPFRLIFGEPTDHIHRKKPHTGKSLPVEKLADEIDWLEAHLDAWGTVVVKKPDIWGEARLTKHRDEYERTMAQQLNGFQATISASIQQADAAFLANSFALSAAASGGAPDVTAIDVKAGDNVDISLPGLNVGVPAGGPVGLEPTTYLNQMSRYIDHLHELRRVHEGDDTSDSPGYAMNLVRIPVSILPGKKTREGFGAEVTITGTPVLSDALMADTMRNLIINDLVDMLSLPVLRYTEIQNNTPRAAVARRSAKAFSEKTDEERTFDKADYYKSRDVGSHSITSGGASRNRRAPFALTPQRIYTDLGFAWLYNMGEMVNYHYHGRDIRWAGGGDGKPMTKDDEQRLHLPDIERYMHQQFDAAYGLITSENHSTLLRQTIDQPLCSGTTLARAIRESRKDDVRHVRQAFYAALADNKSELKTIGEPGGRASGDEYDVTRELSTAQLLAWPVVVEMALLNEQLHEDIVRLAFAKGGMNAPAQQLPYYLPIRCLSVECGEQGDYREAAQVFQDYVRWRWPIHIFALDPVEEEQNVADALARRRELQLAMSLKFMSGRMSAANVSKFARKLETEIQTISLNRTIVGFSHGSDTFGWRFTPRMQTPPPPGNLVAFGQTLFGGPSRECDLSKRLIEPGMRECVAIVLMPSFVPYCDFNVHTNWYKLRNPKNTEISTRDTLELSRVVRSMQNSAAQCAECQHLYRDGEVDRLMKRVHQLDQELPLQTLRVQVPFENTLGGFEMFNTGMTDLAPELRGWYGAPGIVVGADAATACTAQPVEVVPTPAVSQTAAGTDCKCNTTGLPLCPGTGTTLFLVGDNLSVHETRIIAGGVCIPHFRLISRGIVQVTIPPCVNLVRIEGKDYVDVHAATPYGVTSHLHIPVTVPPATAKALADAKEALTEDVVRKLAIPQLKLATTDPLLFKAKVESNGTSAVELHTTSRGKKFTIALADNFPEFSDKTGQPDAITVLVALGQDGKLVSEPAAISLVPRGLTDGKLSFSNDDVAQVILPELKKLSEGTQLTENSDALKFDLVVYQILSGTQFPRIVDGTGQIELQREPSQQFNAPRAAVTETLPPVLPAN